MPNTQEGFACMAAIACKAVPATAEQQAMARGRWVDQALQFGREGQWMAHASLWPMLRHHWPHQSMVHMALHRARTPDATYGSWCVCYGVTRPPPKPADCARLFSLSTPHGQVWLYALSSLGCGQAAAALAEVGPTAIPHADLQSVAGPASLIFLDRGIIEVTQTIAWYLTSLASQPALHVDWTNMWMCHGMPQVTKVVPNVAPDAVCSGQ